MNGWIEGEGVIGCVFIREHTLVGKVSKSKGMGELHRELITCRHGSVCGRSPRGSHAKHTGEKFNSSFSGNPHHASLPQENKTTRKEDSGARSWSRGPAGSCLSQLMRWKRSGKIDSLWWWKSDTLYVKSFPIAQKSPKYVCWGLIRFLIDANGLVITV